MNTVERLAHISRLPGPVLAVSPLAHTEEVLAATERSAMLHLDLHSGTVRRRFEGSAGPRYAALAHPALPLAFSAGADGIPRLWDLQTARCLCRFEGHFGPARCIACTPDGKRLVSGGDDGTLRVWDADTGKEAA